MTYLSTEIEIDASEIVSDAHSDIYSIAEEAVAEYDISDKVQEEVETALENVINDKIEEYLLENPAAILDAIGRAIGWAQERQRLVVDQAKELETKRRRIVELERHLEEINMSATPKTEETSESDSQS